MGAKPSTRAVVPPAGFPDLHAKAHAEEAPPHHPAGDNSCRNGCDVTASCGCADDPSPLSSDSLDQAEASPQELDGVLPEEPASPSCPTVPYERSRFRTINVSLMTSPTSVPDTFVAQVLKLRRKFSKVVGHNMWSKRYLELVGGRMYWGKDLRVPKDWHCIDFRTNPCTVELERSKEGIHLVLRPKEGGNWNSTEKHSRSGTDRPFVIKVDRSKYNMDEWAGRFQEHVDYGRATSALATSRTAAFHTAPEDDLSDEECPICLEPLADDDAGQAVETACGHRFHRNCGREWLKKDVSCPVCRMRILDDSARMGRKKRKIRSARRHGRARTTG